MSLKKHLSAALAALILVLSIPGGAICADATMTMESSRVSATQPLYGLTNVLSSQDADKISDVEVALGAPVGFMASAYYYNSSYYADWTSFDVDRMSNSDLFDMAKSYYLYYSGNPIGDDILLAGGNDAEYEVRGVAYEQVNEFMLRHFGRTIDFTPFEVAVMPEPTPYSDVLVYYAWDGYFCKQIAYTGFSSFQVSIQQLVEVGDGIYAAEMSVTENDLDMSYYIGSLVAVLKLRNGDFQIKKIYPFEEVPSFDEVARYTVTLYPESDFTVDYDALSDHQSLSDYVDTLRTSLAGSDAFNDAGNSAITTYIEFAVQDSTAEAVQASDNRVAFSADLLSALKAGAMEARDTLLSELGSISLRRAPLLNVRIDVRRLDLSKPIEVSLDKAGIEALNGINTLTILLENNRHRLTASISDLQSPGGLFLRLESAADDEYALTFLDESGNVIDASDAPVTVTLPASDVYASVHAMIDGHAENWGGQYDALNGTISFQTPYTGTYTVLQMSEDIEDISMLEQEEQDAIRFMVAKDILELYSSGKFSPGSEMTRYQFAKALVKIFFALDREAVCSFTDIAADNPYYPYIASGQQEGIINGYGDNTYRGDGAALRWHVIAFCARTIAAKLGYAAPEDISLYLNYADNDLLLETCNDEDTASIALAVREGLIPNGGTLRPDQPVTKGEAALILYRLYMLLYQVSPAEIVAEEAEEVAEEPGEEAVEEPGAEPGVAGDVAADESEENSGLSPQVIMTAIFVGTAVVTAALIAGTIIVLKRSRR